jgi:hypothetical protein
MANRKISDLTALTAPATGDLLPIVDISEAAAADKNKKITIGELFASIPLGTAAAPSVAFEGDSNTGIYSPGADQLAISTNGTQRATIDSSGRLLVGTSTSRTTTNTPQILVESVNTTTGDRGITVVGGGASSVSPLINFAKHRSASIGGTTAASNNDFTGAIVFNGSDGTNFIQSALIAAAIDGTPGANDMPGRLVFSTTADGSASPTERMRITSAGLVGLGTSSPGTQLHVNGGYNGSIANRLTLSTTFDGNADSGSGIYFKNYYNNAVISAYSNPSSGQGGTLRFQTYNSDVSLNTGMLINAAGNVGIGTTSPGSALDASSSTGTRIRSTYTATGGGRDAGFEIFGNGAANSSFVYAGNLGVTTISSLLVTALNIGGSERARIDSSGRLLVGTTTGSEKFTLADGNISLYTSSYSSGEVINKTITSYAKNGAVSNLYDKDAEICFGKVNGFDVDYTHGGFISFKTTDNNRDSAPTERMRITNAGNCFLGSQTSISSERLGITFAASAQGIAINVASGASQTQVLFANPNGTVGTITTSGSATAYNTSSDYRLKENVSAVTDGITRLQKLKPSRFNFIADPDHTVDGFIAHEAQAVVPECVTGTKDEVGEDGNPVYQGIDQAKLVPLLTAALQEAITKIETLEARLTADGIA